MRLVKAEIHGFGRLAECTVNLDNRVVAVVGPNEAGKTTLLRALAYINDGKTLSPSHRSRGLGVADDHAVVKVRYILDPDDVAVTKQFELREPPRSLWLSRTATGAAKPRVEVEPPPMKSIIPLEDAFAALQREMDTVLEAARSEAPSPDEPGGTTSVESPHLIVLSDVRESVSALLDDANTDDIEAAVRRNCEPLHASAAKLAHHDLGLSLQHRIKEVLAWIDNEDPATAVADALYQRSPRILLFEEEDRSLASTYSLTKKLVADAPKALSNLAEMAELDLESLWKTYEDGDEGERETLIDNANQVLAKKFAVAWKQSNISVLLKTEGTTLAIRIRQGGNRITQFDERSAGLKMFVALVAFLAVQNQTTPPVLLIDEAENHLHIDAQADLVNTFMSQQQAAKIIYTTHSPACLPPDLGSNIRAVVPDPDHEYRSLIQGSFWSGAAGFAPLMLAMGAGAAAFSTARYVVLGEGASEMLLLPRLIKLAIGTSDLEYQVAPGLAEVPAAMYPELDLVAARVACVLDGDTGGVERRRALVSGGVPEECIVMLGAPTLENLLEADLYLRGVESLLVECNPGSTIPNLPSLPDPSETAWPTILEEWARTNALRMPGKRAIASRLVENALGVPSEYGLPILRKLHRELESALKTTKI